jgi:hypothetical protein
MYGLCKKEKQKVLWIFILEHKKHLIYRSRKKLLFKIHTIFVSRIFWYFKVRFSSQSGFSIGLLLHTHCTLHVKYPHNLQVYTLLTCAYFWQNIQIVYLLVNGNKECTHIFHKYINSIRLVLFNKKKTNNITKPYIVTYVWKAIEIQNKSNSRNLIS